MVYIYKKELRTVNYVTWMIIIKDRFEFSFSTGYSFPDYVTKSEYDKKQTNSLHRAPERLKYYGRWWVRCVC